MIRPKSTIEDIINPCAIPETNRHQAFVEAQNSTYSANGEIRFTLPTSEILDLTESYLDMLVSMNTTDAAVDTVYTLDLTAAVGGSFRFEYNGKASPEVAIAGITAPIIEAALLATPTIGQDFFAPSVDGTGAPVYVITVPPNAATSFGFGANLNYIVVDNYTTPPTAAFPLELTTVGSLEYPRMEFLNPIVRQLRLDVNSLEIVNITGANYLTSIFELLESAPTQYSQFYLNRQFPEGYRPTDTVGQQTIQWRVKYKLNIIDFMKKILPLRLMNVQVRLYMTLEQNNMALIQGPTGGGQYTIDTPRLHYHRIDLSREEEALVNAALAGAGLVIPFQNVVNFQQNISSGNTNTNILFNPSVQNMLGVLFIFVPNTYTADPENNQKFAVWLRNALGQYRLKVGSGYYPLDQIDSIGPNNQDMTQPITELEILLDKIEHNEALGYDRQIYFNYAGDGQGNDPNTRQFIVAFDSSYAMRFVAGISTTNAPTNGWGISCHYNTGLPGVDTSMLSNVSLELRNMSLDQDNTVQIFTYHQDYLVVRSGGRVEWVK